MVKVKVPASTANLGPGFDALGMALNLYLQVSIAEADRTEVTLDGLQGTPPDLTNNLIYQGAIRLYDYLGRAKPGLTIQINNGIPMGKGLGSSAAAWLAGLGAANRILGDALTSEELLTLALELEGHPDNIVPAMVGGMTVAMPVDGKIEYQKVKIDAALKVIVAVPDFILPTEDSRAMIPSAIPLAAMAANLQRTGFLVAAFIKQEYEKLSWAMQDACIENFRKPLIPGFDLVIRAAKEAGALSAVISGAGPSIAAWTLNNPAEIATAMQTAWQTVGIEAKVYLLEADNEGLQYI